MWVGHKHSGSFDVKWGKWFLLWLVLFAYILYHHCFVSCIIIVWWWYISLIYTVSLSTKLVSTKMIFSLACTVFGLLAFLLIFHFLKNPLDFKTFYLQLYVSNIYPNWHTLEEFRFLSLWWVLVLFDIRCFNTVRICSVYLYFINNML